jgi:hypothetical protein
MERLEVSNIVSGKQDIDTLRDSITSGGSGMPGADTLGGHGVGLCADASVSALASTQRRRSASDGF